MGYYSHRKEVITDLYCNVGYSSHRKEVITDLYCNVGYSSHRKDVITDLYCNVGFSSHREEVITDLYCNVGYCLLRRGGGADLFSFSQPLTRPVNFWRRGFQKQFCKCIWLCVWVKKGQRGRGQAISQRPLCCKCEVVNFGQPVYIASLGQHVVVTTAMWYSPEHFPP